MLSSIKKKKYKTRLMSLAFLEQEKKQALHITILYIAQ